MTSQEEPEFRVGREYPTDQVEASLEIVDSGGISQGNYLGGKMFKRGRRRYLFDLSEDGTTMTLTHTYETQLQ